MVPFLHADASLVPHGDHDIHNTQCLCPSHV